jgi:predicted  nucleic acid-binding Zn-ribbon protein
VLADSQKAEIGRLMSQIHTLKDQLARANEATRAAETGRAADRGDLSAATNQLKEERVKFEHFHRRVTELVQQTVARTIEDRLVARTSSLRARLGPPWSSLDSAI